MNVDEQQVRDAARMLIESRDTAERVAAERRRYQKAQGHSIDLRAEHVEGSAAAYAVSISIFAAVFGQRIDVLAGEDWRPARGIMPPMLPDRDAIGGLTPERVTIAAVAHARQNTDKGDHFAYPTDDELDPLPGDMKR